MIRPMEPPEFAKRMMNFERTMEGEDRESSDPDDVLLWRAVYADMVRFKKQLLVEIKEHIERVPATGPELGGHDVPFLENELRRLQNGLDHWSQKAPR